MHSRLFTFLPREAALSVPIPLPLVRNPHLVQVGAVSCSCSWGEDALQPLAHAALHCWSMVSVANSMSGYWSHSKRHAGDLKPENFCLAEPSTSGKPIMDSLRLIDFGLSQRVRGGQAIAGLAGGPRCAELSSEPILLGQWAPAQRPRPLFYQAPHPSLGTACRRLGCMWPTGHGSPFGLQLYRP